MPYRPAKRHQQRIVSWNKSETGPSPFPVMAYFRERRDEGIGAQEAKAVSKGERLQPLAINPCTPAGRFTSACSALF